MEEKIRGSNGWSMYDCLGILPDILIFFLFFIGTFVFFQERRNRGLPPGPRGLPFLGYLPWLDSKAPYKTLSSLVDRYGKMYSVQLGSVQTVVISDPEVIRKIFNMEETTGRAPLYLTHGIMRGYGLICSEGDLWKEHRRFLVGFMRSTGMKKAANRDELQEWIASAAQEFVQGLQNCPEEGLDINHSLMHYIGNIMNELIFGLHYLEDDTTWMWLRRLLDEGSKLIAVTGPINFIPWLRFLPSLKRNIQFIRENQVKTHKEYEKILRAKEEQMSDHKFQESQKLNGLESDIKTRTNLMEQFIQERNRRGSAGVGSFSDDQIFHVAADLFGAGTETTLTTLRWHLLDLALHPKIQSEIRRELSTLTDSDGFIDEFISMENIAKIPLCLASIAETQRLRSIVPTGIPHGALKDIEVDGFIIPKGTMIMPLIWRIHRDDKYWNDPLNFDPHRFLDRNGELLKMPSAFMPFQTGRRICPGEEFAKMILITFVTKILQNFRISLPENSRNVDPTADPVCGLTLTPRPFNLVFTPA